MYVFRIKPFVIGHAKQRANDITSQVGGSRITGDAEAIPSAGNFYVEAAFDLSQVLVELAAKIGETMVVYGFQDKVPGYLYGVQCWVRKPLEFG